MKIEIPGKTQFHTCTRVSFSKFSRFFKKKKILVLPNAHFIYFVYSSFINSTCTAAHLNKGLRSGLLSTLNKVEEHETTLTING